MRLATLVLLIAATSAAFLPGAPTPFEDAVAVHSNRTDSCSCVLYTAPDCPEARDEFVCMSGCIERGYEFPGRCDTVLGCCVYLETVNREVTCQDEGSYVRFDCGQSCNATADMSKMIRGD